MTFSFFIYHFSFACPVLAQDTIVLAPRPDESGRIVLTGKVLDYTGAALTYENAGGAKQTVPGRQVVELRSTWTPDHTAGDDLWRRREFAAAAVKYQTASAVEPRRWVRRLLMSRLVACLRETDRWEQAAEQFLSLVREDPATPYFAVLPPAWTTINAPPSLETKAKAWSSDRASAVAALIGSSYLLSTASRPQGLTRLRELALDADPRIAILAEAQIWRTAAVTADADQLAGWERVLDKLPEPLRAGPYLVIGKGWNAKNEPERAALLLLRLPILYGDDQPRLAAEGLYGAGQALEKLSRPRQACTLYHELVRDFSQAAIAPSAEQRLKELTTLDGSN